MTPASTQCHIIVFELSAVAVGNLLEWLSCDVLNPFLIFLWKSMQMKQDAMLGGCEKIGFLSDLVLDC